MRSARIKTILTVCLLLCCFLNGSISSEDKPKDVDGWSKAKWGMSEEEILDLFHGDAIREADPWHNEKTGLVTLISIKKTEIAGGTFKVDFDFDSPTNELRRIFVRPVSELVGVSEFVARDIQKMLVEKYS